MRNTERKLPQSRKEQGALIILTLLILMVVSMLGMASIDSTGLEMKMSSNSRNQQMAFEAAEYTLSWVENDLAESGYFSTESITNGSSCGAVCFSSSCTNGYCFTGISPDSWSACQVGAGATEPYEDEATWSAAASHRTLNIPNSDITAKYIIEFWCYASRVPGEELSDLNKTPVYRITAYTEGEGGKARAMLRSTVKQN
jgi:type IV pilus assembly protein PilX